MQLDSNIKAFKENEVRHIAGLQFFHAANVFIEGFNFGETYTKEETAQKLRNTVDLYGKGGGAYINVFEFDPERAWNMVSKIYAYSREYYDSEREK